MSYYLGEAAISAVRLRECAAICREHEDHHGYAYALVYLSSLVYRQGDIDAGGAMSKESEEIVRSLGEPWGLGMALWTEGYITLMGTSRPTVESAAAACPLLEESAGLLHRSGDRWAASAPLIYHAWARCELGDYRTSRALAHQAIESARAVGDRLRVGMFSYFLGGWATKQGDFATASAVLRESLQLRYDINDESGAAGCFEKLAALEVAQSRAGSSQPALNMSRGARLLGAAEAVRTASRSSPSPTEQEDIDDTLAAIKQVLGKEALMAAQADGGAMTVKHAVAYGLEERDVI